MKKKKALWGKGIGKEVKRKSRGLGRKVKRMVYISHDPFNLKLSPPTNKSVLVILPSGKTLKTCKGDF